MQTQKDSESVYEGQVVNGIREGFGICKWIDGSCYEGEWFAGNFNGWGVLYTGSGGKFSGQFKNNLLDGLGKSVYKNGDVQMGEYKAGNLHGYAISYSKERNTWCLGFFQNGRNEKLINEGEGMPSYLELLRNEGNFEYSEQIFKGNKYIGEVLEGKREGNGVLYLKQGGKFEGSWKNNYPNGVGIFDFGEGKVAIGNFKDGLLHGLGKMYFSNGDWFFGNFENGEISGEGTFFSSVSKEKVSGTFYDNTFIES